MPYAKRKFYKRKGTRKYTRTTRKRRPSTRYRRNAPISRIGVVPATSVVRMRYVDQVTINPAIDSMGVYQFRSNSIFDPNYTGIGHQPLGHDQAAALYENYTVIGARITAKFAVQSAEDGSIPSAVGIYADYDATPPTSLQHLIEQGRCRYKTLIANGASGSAHATLTYNFGSKKFFGYKDLKDVQSQVGSPFGANPARQSYFVLFVAPIESNLNDIPPVSILVTIDYIVRLTEPLDLSQS